MNLDNFDISNCKELIKAENIDFDTHAFYKITEIVKTTLIRLGINPEGMKIYYERNCDTTSILAIKVTKGSDNNINNYMFNGCKAWRHGSNVNCDVSMHAEAKSAQTSMKLANLISRDIVSFFEKIEKELLKTNNFDLSLSLIMPLETKEKKEQKGVKQLLKSIFKK